VVACLYRDLRARLEVAIERVLELVQQVDRQKAVSPSHGRRSSVDEEVYYTAITTTTFEFLTDLLLLRYFKLRLVSKT